MRIPEPSQLGPADTIPLHPQTAGCNPDFILIARSKSKRRYARAKTLGISLSSPSAQCTVEWRLAHEQGAGMAVVMDRSVADAYARLEKGALSRFAGWPDRKMRRAVPGVYTV